MARDLGFSVPPEHREAAELICEHLVSVRGGALFLSNADALRLLDWLDRRVPVPHILVAIDHAWLKRQKKRSRLPLTLGQANRYLGKPSPGAFSGAPEGEVAPGLAPLLARLSEAVESGDPHGARLAELRNALAGIDSDSEQRTAAMALITRFHTRLWQDLPAAEQQSAREAARGDLGDLVHMVDEPTLVAIVEEAAIGHVRRGYAWLSVASVQDLLGAPQ